MEYVKIVHIYKHVVVWKHKKHVLIVLDKKVIVHMKINHVKLLKHVVRLKYRHIV